MKPISRILQKNKLFKKSLKIGIDNVLNHCFRTRKGFIVKIKTKFNCRIVILDILILINWLTTIFIYKNTGMIQRNQNLKMKMKMMNEKLKANKNYKKKLNIN